MFRKILETIVGGAIGMAALYAVAKIAYCAGRDVEKAEQMRERLAAQEGETEQPQGQEEPAKPETRRGERKPGVFSAIKGIRKVFGRGGGSVIGELVRDPEEHKLEAYVREGEVHINIEGCIAARE